MRALICTPGGPVALGDVPDPEPASDEAVIELRASSLNRGEVRWLASAEPGYRPGWDVAGVVLQAAADGSGPAVGARVVGLLGEGAWAERVAVQTGALAELPDAVSFEAASVLPIAGVTAYRCLELGGLAVGKRVLVTGAAGGVGRLAIQLAHLGGAHVTAVVGRPERAAGLAGLGADEVLVGPPEDEGRYDVVLESVGGAMLTACLGRLAPGGTLVMFGGSSGEPAALDPRQLFSGSHAARLVPYLVFTDHATTGCAGRTLARLAGLVAAGALSPEITVTASWRVPGAAIQALIERSVAGKAVLLVD